MKLSKKLEAEVLKAYKAYWDAYLKGDMKTFASMLADDLTVFGTAVSEVFNNKKETLRFYKATADQLVGKAQFRSRQINVQAVDNNILVNEQSDFYFLMDGKWTFYGPARISAVFKQTNKGWKLAHQHASFPDTRADEGEQFATEKIKEENQQLRDAVKRRTVELEEKNRELEIETSLEKVRAQALGMHKADELMNVCKVLFKELIALGFTGLRNAIIHSFNDDKAYFTDYDYSDSTGGAITNISYNANAIVKKFIKQIRKSDNAFVQINIKGTELRDWKRFRKKGGQPDDPLLNKASAIHYYLYSIQNASIGISTFNVINKEQLQLLKRFRNVFDFAYRRYMDIAQAEAQTREAQIEVAVERVRAKALAMHRSDEIHGVVRALRNELFGLKLEGIIGATICLKQADGQIRFWDITDVETTGRYGWDIVFDIGKIDSRLWVKKIWDSKKQIISTEQDSSDLKRALKWLGQYDKKTANEIVKLLEINNIKHGWHRAVRLAHGRLITDFANEPPSEIDSILLKIGVAFDLAYRRFLDLQKAEAQAREAQIEAALEKIRSRSLAMQKTDELNEVITVVLQKLQELGFTMGNRSTAIFTYKTNSKDYYQWVASPQLSSAVSLLTPYFDHPIHNDIWNARKMQADFLAKSYSQKVKNSFIRYLFENTDARQMSREEKDWTLSQKSFDMAIAFEKNSAIAIADHSGVTMTEDEVAVLKKIARVFEQSYIRFLDLQKAEAQTREAQIEVAVERVRAKALAMHKSEEIIDVVSILWKELTALKIAGVIASTIYLRQEDGRVRVWDLTSANELKEGFTQEMDVVFNLRETDKRLWVSKVLHSNSNYSVIEESDFTKVFQWVEKFVGKKAAMDGKQFIKANNVKKLWIPTVSLEYGKLSCDFIQPPPAEMQPILLKMGAAFDLAYKRFLDLQNAEAQAREAQIEAALEKIRSRSLAMHHSNELKQVIAILFQKLNELNVLHGTVAIQLFDHATLNSFLWVGNAIQDPQMVNMPYDKKMMLENTYLKDGWEAMREGKNIINKEYSLKEKNKFFKYVFANNDLTQVPEGAREVLRKIKRHIICLFTEKNSALFVDSFDGQFFSKDNLAIIKRAGKVFEQCYIRFLDLQKAEAQTRESQIQLALERVRARTMAMHHSDELTDVVKLLYQEFDKLKINNESTDIEIGLIDEETGIASIWAHFYLSDGTISTFNFPTMLFDEVREEIEKWKTVPLKKRNELFFTTEFSQERLKKFVEIAVQLPELAEIFRPLIEAKITKWVTHNAYFSHGFLTLQGTEAYSPETQEIQKRFAKVFEQTYTRFLDLKKAEAQAREAQIEASLERVRGRTMAMHESSDLLDVVRVLGGQLEVLGIRFDSVNFNTDYPKRDWNLWLYNSGVPMYPDKLHIPYLDHPCFNRPIEAYKEGADFQSFIFTKEEKDSLFDHIYANSIARNAPEERKRYTYAAPGLVWSVAYGKHTAVTISNYRAEPFSDEENAILKRFANVFEQSYTRFLDLEKAEAQAREAEIELALERVRARTMAMQKSDELRETVLVIYEQLKLLHFESSACNIIIIDKESGSAQYWVSGFSQEIFPVSYNVPYLNHPYHDALLKPWKQGDKYVVYEYTGKMKQSFDEIFFTQTEFKNIPDEAKNVMIGLKSVILSTAFITYGAIQSLGTEPLSDENASILQRFAKVFEQTYTRFLDLQKAEAQARESQIQLALERVRARTMAMQKSDELAEAASLLFTQIADLGTNSWSSGFIIFQPDELSINSWMSKPDGSMGVPFNIPVTKDPFFIKIYEAYKRGEEFFVMESSGKELEETYKYMFSLPGAAKALGAIEDIGFQMPTFQITHCVFFANGFLMFITYDSCQEMWEIFKRFGKVFEQTYTRFLDLQKAEAQAREAKIEAVLERIRSRTMAMQKSDELTAVAGLLFEQVSALGIKTWTAGFNVWSEDNNSYVDYITSPQGGFIEPYTVLTETAEALRDISNARKSGVEFDVQYVEGEKIKQLYLALTKLDEKQYEIMLQDGVRFPSHQYEHFVFGSKVSLMFITYEPVPEAHDIFKRLGKVFEQTYTRFLDLQKAEAQARESQIEAALERVRARSMGMQKSDELAEVVAVLYKQLEALDFGFYQVLVSIYDKKNNVIEWWSRGFGDIELPQRNIIPIIDHPFPNVLLEKWENGVEYYPHILEGEMKKSWEEYLFTKTDLKNFPQPIKDTMRSIDKVYLSDVFMKYGSLQAAGPTPLPDDKADILKRFVKVVDLAYTRMKDLQMAESQAREAQIELGLERVRSRAMAMQTSEELNELIGTVFTELTKLDFVLTRCVILIYEGNEKGVRWWMANSEAPSMPASFFVKYTNLPFFNEYLQGWYDRSLKWQYILEGENKVKTDDFLFGETELSRLPDFVIRGMRAPERVYLNASFNNFGNLTLASLEPLSDEHFDILLRFAKVFDLTYTRFSDLKQAEAQAKESRIQLALERVRARTMAMQRSDELMETAVVLFDQLNQLGENIERTMIGVMNEEERVVDVWATRPDGSQMVSMQKFPVDEPILMQKVYAAWRQQKKSIVIDLRGEELESYFQFLKSRSSKLKRESFGERRVENFAFFSKGILGVINADPDKAANVELYERFAAVFEQTYTRFLDLQKAEAQTREAQIEAALERVRSRAMAMHKTNELLDAAELIYKELTALGITSMNVSYAFVDEEEKHGSYYSVNPVDGKTLPFPFVFPHTETEVMRSLLSGWRKQEPFNVIELDEEATLKHQTYIGEHIQQQIAKNNPEIPFTVDAFLAISPQKAVIYNFNFAQGYIFVIGSKRLTTEQEQMMLRFTKVFELAYRRFLDIKQAEALAREAQIELALERVRARTMAMHRSEELAETAQVMFHQLQELGGIPDRMSIGVANEEAGVVNFWTTDQSGSHINNSFAARLNEKTVIEKTYKAWKENKKSLVIDLHGDEVNEWIRFAREEMNIVVDDKQIKDRRVHTLAFFSHGWILVTTHELQTAETIQILERFASVFNLTYRRFLDLQKAEAQANEARIEISLERIRARALAMHKSDELIEVAKVLWEQMALLGQPELEASVVHLYEYDPDHIISSRAVSIGTDSSAKLTYGQMAIPKNSCEVVREWLEKFYSDSKEYTIELSGAKQKEWYDVMDKLAPDVVNSMRQKGSLSEKRFYRFSKFSGGALLMVSTQEPSLEVAYLQKRAAAVFDLAYRRFSDLQKTEAQARESEIELALERVRAKSMSMRHSDELADLVRILFKELNSIGFSINGCIIMTYDERTNDSTWWIANSDGVSNPLGLLVPNHSHAPYQAYLKEWKKQTPKWSYRLGGAEKKEWDQYVFTNSGLAALPDPVKAAMQSVEDVQLNVCFNKYASITFGSLEPMGDKDFDTLHRFAKVFEQSYTRFLDLQNAEAQAREAKIEAALERVRAKAMAMHKSEDLHEAVKIMFEEFQKLNLDVLRCGVGILNKNSRTGSVWATSVSDDGLAVQISADESFETHPLMMLIYEYWQKQQDLDYILQGQDLINYYRAMKESDLKLPESQLSFSEAELQPQYYYGAMFKAGGLYAFKEKPFAEEDRKIMKRFASVVNLTYNRFLDLQKAEASAREAQIEVGLERVRAKAMAMHSSEDLAETIKVFYHQMASLSITPIRCGIGIVDKETHIAELSTMNTTEQQSSIEVIGKLKMSGHPVLEGVFEHWLTQTEYSPVLRDKEINEYYQLMKTQVAFPDYPEDVIQFGYFFYFSEGWVYTWTNTDLKESELKIYRRFTSVLSLTYKRYKDLIQAEANAREAQIEAGLERVRARTMAMHSSDDVSAATATMFIELEKLGIPNLRGGITIIRPDQTQEVWSVTNLPDGTTLRAIGVFDMRLHPLWRELFSAFEKKEDYSYYRLAGKDKEDYIAILNATPNYLAQPIKEIPDVHVQSYFFGEGGVWTNSLEPHSEDDKQIMKRFASVFALTFRRYQDLKKAEAQAKEATIEAALEKVRGQAMAMHNSNDLSVTTSIIIGELKKLGITPIRCGVGIINKETHKAQLYTARFSPDGDSLSVVGWVLLKGHLVLETIYEKWVHGEDYYPELSGDSRKAYYERLLAGLSIPIPDFRDDEIHYGHFFSFSVGCLYAWSEVKYNDDEIKILKRFASIIDLTFRRYFELQKSEANAREAVKQAALDRVRADIASMRTVSDLDRITPLIWKELTILGVPFIRCGVFIMDETQKLIHTFLSTPDGKAIAAFHLPYDTPGNVSKVLENWQHKKIYVDHWDKEEFSQFADILMKQGTLTSREQYLKTIPEGGFYLHFLPFLQGMLYVGNTDQLIEEQIELIQHVADAFSTAYARYEDFNKLEAAKQQVENTLTDLKQAQQQLVQSEKMASLGELTAGIAHEIQNPLNFVNNFSDVSNELLEEMKHELEKGNKEDAIALVDDVKQNLEKILHHGKRADAIVKGMLQHSRTSSGQKEPTDINVLADEYLRLSFHGLRAKDKSFNAKFETHFDNSIGKISVIPQDIGRVILNLINNAFYAVTEKKKHASAGSASNGYEPTVTVTTKKENGKIEIKVRDNGSGIPQRVLDKIFQPFFTTKPTGQGTGLGLSLAYDIITKGHGGELKVETKEGEGTEFIIQIPVSKTPES